MLIQWSGKEALETVLQQGKVIVDFYADWCGPCKIQGPVLQTFATSHPEITIVKINVDQFSDLAEKYGVLSIPTLFVFQEGQQIYKKPGFHTLPQLEAL